MSLPESIKFENHDRSKNLKILLTTDCNNCHKSLPECQCAKKKKTTTREYRFGPAGPRGPTGARGPVGPRGPTGPKGSRWFVQDNTEIATGKTPKKSDYLLNTKDCQIYQFICDEWVPTGEFLSCVDCQQVIDCLKKISCDPCPSQCTIFFSLLDCDRIFFGQALEIRQLIINGETQSTPVGTFTSPEGLAQLLAPSEWVLNKQFDTNFYVRQWSDVITKESQIVFAEPSSTKVHIVTIDSECPQDKCGCPQCDLSNAKVLVKTDDNLFWVDKTCLCQGNATEIECQVVEQCLCDYPEFKDNCEYVGIYDPKCTDFIDSLNGTTSYQILTALNNLAGLVSGPISFNTIMEFEIALEALNIVIIDGLITVTSSPSEINRVFILNPNGNPVASFSLTQTNCCPDEDCLVLVKGDDNKFNWVRKSCFNQINKTKLINLLNTIPECRDFRCVLTIKISDIFLNVDPAVNPFPWVFSEFILLGVDLTSVYNTPFNSISELKTILENNGWVELVANSGFYQMVVYLDSIDNLGANRYRVMDVNNAVFVCREITQECSDSCPIDSTQLLFRNSQNGEFCLGSAHKVCSLIPECTEQAENAQYKLTGQVIYRAENTDDCCWKTVDLDIEKSLCAIKDCVQEITYQICIDIDQCQIDTIIEQYGDASQFFICQYRLADDTIQLVNQAIDSPLSLSNLANAFEKLGWAIDTSVPDQLRATMNSPDNIQYVVLSNGQCPQVNGPAPPYLSTNCTEVIDCTARDPDNKILIKRASDDQLCWTTEQCLIPPQTNVIETPFNATISFNILDLENPTNPPIITNPVSFPVSGYYLVTGKKVSFDLIILSLFVSLRSINDARVTYIVEFNSTLPKATTQLNYQITLEEVIDSDDGQTLVDGEVTQNAVYQRFSFVNTDKLESLSFQVSHLNLADQTATIPNVYLNINYRTE